MIWLSLIFCLIRLVLLKTGSLGDYLGLPTFGTRISSTKLLSDAPCSSASRLFGDLSLDKLMSYIRSDELSSAGLTCGNSLNTDGTQSIVFRSSVSTTAIPSNVSQVGIDVTLTGGQSDIFDGARGFFVFLDDSQSYGFEIPVEFKKSPDGVVGFRISSVDPSRLGFVEGSPLVAVVETEDLNTIL